MPPIDPRALRQDLLGFARSSRGHDTGALLAGAVSVLGFAPFHVWPLAILGPAALFLLWRECGRGRAAWRGWLFGVGYWGAGVYWVYHSIHQFGAAIAPLAVVATVAFAFGLALTLALLGFGVGSHRGPRGPAWCLLVLPGAWIVLEWFRSWFLTGFPWLLIGTSQVDTWLGGYAPILGVYGVGLLMAFMAGAIAAWPRAHPAVRAGLVVAIAAIWAGGWAVGGVRWTRPSDLPFDAALVQGNIGESRKFSSLDDSLDRYTRMTRKVAGDAELVVWPETAIPTFYYQVADRMNTFAHAMEKRDTQVVSGVFTYDRDSDRYFNAVRQLGPGHPDYRKRRLVPFGEYLPLHHWLTFLSKYVDIPMNDISPGRPQQPVLQVGRYRLGASVCYEAAYPNLIRNLAARAGVLVNVSNDGWFGDTTAPFQHLQIARMRALETGRWLLRATNTGISAIIGPHGGVRARGPQFRPTIVEARVEPRSGLTPFVRWGSIPTLVLAFAMALGPWAWRRFRRRRGVEPR